MSSVGLLIYVMVDSAAAAIEAVVANGGEIVQPIGAMLRRLRRGIAILRGMFWLIKILLRKRKHEIELEVCRHRC